MASPIYDYKILYSKLTGEYQVAVVEKFGYGYSDISGLSRDVVTLVEGDRNALKAAGVEAGMHRIPAFCYVNQDGLSDTKYKQNKLVVYRNSLNSDAQEESKCKRQFKVED